jgi:hypothetical protein
VPVSPRQEPHRAGASRTTGYSIARNRPRCYIASRTMNPTATVYIATSLDGFIAREDGGLDWLPPIEGSGEGD